MRDDEILTVLYVFGVVREICKRIAELIVVHQGNSKYVIMMAS